MSLHVIIGAGPVGSATAVRLAAEGRRVRIITRSGAGPDADGVEPIGADATDAERLASLTAGADVVYNCACPPYHRWPQDWPPLAASVLAAAEHAGAVLVTMSNLYGYGPVGHAISERDPLAATGPKGRTRASVWAQALAAHQADRVRATEARASDFFGPGVRGQSPIGERSIPACWPAVQSTCSAIPTRRTAGPSYPTSRRHWSRWALRNAPGDALGTCPAAPR